MKLIQNKTHCYKICTIEKQKLFIELNILLQLTNKIQKVDKKFIERSALEFSMYRSKEVAMVLIGDKRTDVTRNISKLFSF